MVDQEMLKAIETMLQGMESRIKADVMQSVNVIIENKVQTQLNLLGEQQRLILEKITPAEKIEDLEDRVSTLEFVVKDLAADVRKLKAAN